MWICDRFGNSKTKGGKKRVHKLYENGGVNEVRLTSVRQICRKPASRVIKKSLKRNIT